MRILLNVRSQVRMFCDYQNHSEDIECHVLQGGKVSIIGSNTYVNVSGHSEIVMSLLGFYVSFRSHYEEI